MRHAIPAIANEATNIFSMGLLNTIGVLQAWVSEHQLNGYSESNVSYTVSTRDLHPVQGPIFDAHDIRYLLVPGSVGTVAAIMCMSVSTGK